ncbi:MAG: thiol oxidoreductase [Chloroflexi bacterium]|nr:thiol oxidoreductase [Chloroflexota bacterium]
MTEGRTRGLRGFAVRYAFVMSVVLLAAGLLACGNAEAAEPEPRPVIGDVPALKQHTDQEAINAGQISVEELIRRGNELFVANFNKLDGAGRPETTDVEDNNFRSMRVFPDNFNRISGPDANSCAACHSLPRLGGAGDNAANVFTLADRLDFATFDGGEGDDFENITLRMAGNERNSLSLFGAGYIEMLSREMTADLQSIRDSAINEARDSGQEVTKSLITKDVSFGSIMARPNGTLEVSKVEGVDTDLIIKPFQQKGVVISLREFMVKAMNTHFGMQAAERFRDGVDADRDGVVDELTRGDITAAVLFLAALAPPGRVMPTHPDAIAAVERGEGLFAQIGCTTCHRTTLRLDDPVFSEPNPYNPPGKLQLSDVSRALSFSLIDDIEGPNLQPEADGSVLVPVFTDLKRHDMGDMLNDDLLVHDGVPTNEFLTRKLWGVASEPPFLHNGRATLLSEAIVFHGGEAQAAREAFEALPKADQDAIVEFLKTLQILPQDATELVVYGGPEGTTFYVDPGRAITSTKAGEASMNALLKSVIGGVVGGLALLAMAGVAIGLRRRSSV